MQTALLTDGAGWDAAAGPAVLVNASLVFLPSYAPELNPFEGIWLHLRERHSPFRRLADRGAVTMPRV